MRILSPAQVSTTSPPDPLLSSNPNNCRPQSNLTTTMGTPAPHDQPKPTTTRRLPPPCWSHDETVALIDAYREKWYSLQRGNLRSPHWQQVADGVFSRCPLGNLPKTSIQCRHKMEKLRKRYRAEVQRLGGNVPNGGQRFPSSWVHFKLMDAMELGVEVEQDGEGNVDDLMLYPKGIKQAIALPLRYPTQFNGNGNGNGVRIKIPNSVPMAPPSGLKLCNSGNGNGNVLFDDYPPTMNLHYGMGNKGLRNGYMKEVEKDRNVGGSGRGGMMKRKAVEVDDDDTNTSSGNVMDEMVTAINKLGDGFVKMERMKMDMARELESMRMKMEMKRTEMIIESHQKLLETFSRTVLDNNKKMKRMPTPES